MKKNEQGLRKMLDTINCTNMHLLKVQGKEEGEKGVEKIFKGIMVEKSPSVLKNIHLHIHKTQ